MTALDIAEIVFIVLVAGVGLGLIIKVLKEENKNFKIKSEKFGMKFCVKNKNAKLIAKKIKSQCGDTKKSNSIFNRNSISNLKAKL